MHSSAYECAHAMFNICMKSVKTDYISIYHSCAYECTQLHMSENGNSKINSSKPYLTVEIGELLHPWRRYIIPAFSSHLLGLLASHVEAVLPGLRDLAVGFCLLICCLGCRLRVLLAVSNQEDLHAVCVPLVVDVGGLRVRFYPEDSGYVEADRRQHCLHKALRLGEATGDHQRKAVDRGKLPKVLAETADLLYTYIKS